MFKNICESLQLSNTAGASGLNCSMQDVGHFANRPYSSMRYLIGEWLLTKDMLYKIIVESLRCKTILVERWVVC